MDLCVICYDSQAVHKPCESCVTRVCLECDARVLPRICITCRGPIQPRPRMLLTAAAMERIHQLYAACTKKLIQSGEYEELIHDIVMYDSPLLAQIKSSIAAHVKRSAEVIRISQIICISTMMYLILSLILSGIEQFNLPVTCLILAYIATQMIRVTRFYFSMVGRVSSTLELMLWLTNLIYVWSVWPIFGSVLVTIAYVQHAVSVLNFHFELFK